MRCRLEESLGLAYINTGVSTGPWGSDSNEARARVVLHFFSTSNLRAGYSGENGTCAKRAVTRENVDVDIARRNNFGHKIFLFSDVVFLGMICFGFFGWHSCFLHSNQ